MVGMKDPPMIISDENSTAENGARGPTKAQSSGGENHLLLFIDAIRCYDLGVIIMREDEKSGAIGIVGAPAVPL